METAQECPKTDTINVGPDQVTIEGNKVTIEARHALPEWQVREYVRIPVYFQEKKYFLRQKSPGQKPFAMRYVLELWPEDGCATTSRVMLEYNEQVVAEREAAIRGGHLEDVAKAALLLVFPFLGMLWSG